MVNDLKEQLKQKTIQVTQLTESLEEVKNNLQQFKAKSYSAEYSLRNELINLRDTEGRQRREITELNTMVKILSNEVKTKELKLQASISDLGLQLNSVKQEKVLVEHLLEEHKRQLAELKEQFGKVNNSIPSEYLDTERNELNQQEVDRLRMECNIKDAQILELQSRL